MANVHGRQAQLGDDTENQTQAKRRKEGTRTTRPALGTITNQIRKQPPRAAKGSNEVEPTDENAGVRQKQISNAGVPFSIFTDENQSQATKEVTKPSKSREVLSAAVTGLPQASSRVLQPLNLPKDDKSASTESPMVLDASTLEVADVDDDEEIEEDESVEEEDPELQARARESEKCIKECNEYSEEILTHMRNAERLHRAKANYIQKQPDITINMRSILVDWMVEVSEEYTLQRETLFLAVNYIDRFLSHMSVLRGKLQLVGAASMFLASKYEEIYPPEIGEFVYITDDTYTKKQILRMEHLILKVLMFHVAVPTINWFSENFLNRTKAGDVLVSLTMFLCELSLLEVDPYIKFLPSTIAASALLTARITLGMAPWPRDVAISTRYTVRELNRCAMCLVDTFEKAPTFAQQAVVEKYKSVRFHNVGTYRPPAELRTCLEQMKDYDYVVTDPKDLEQPM